MMLFGYTILLTPNGHGCIDPEDLAERLVRLLWGGCLHISHAARIPSAQWDCAPGAKLKDASILGGSYAPW